MNIKVLFMSALLAGVAGTAFAQEKPEVGGWKDNFFISVGVGAQGNVNPDSKFGNTITPLVNVSVGKYITPVWGVRGQAYGWSSKMVTNYPFAAINGPEVKRKENYVGINVDGMINLSSLFGGYNPDRDFEFMFFAGPSMNVVANYSGWDVVWDEVRTPVEGGTLVQYVPNPETSQPNGHAVRYLVGASVGAGAKYNVNNSLAIDLEVRGQVTPSILGSLSSGRTDGYVYASAGVTYVIGGKKLVSNKALQETYDKELAQAQKEVAAQREEAKAAQEELEQTKAQAAKDAEAFALALAQKDTITLVVAGPRSVFFKIESAKIDDYSKVNLNLAAEIMKQNPDKKYKIAGYADAATGTKEFNVKLSEKRAKAVYNYLVEQGVSEEQLEIVVGGPTNELFWTNQLNRVVVIE